ncbi:MAG: ATP-dependent DNA helicase RecG, partial [Chloroflexi bacterium]|nr:ATP-dependent DNA helicase RecG [Chloroflexota bacterium]
ARRPAAPRPTDPAEILELPIGSSGLPGAATVARARRHLGILTVRDLLFHLPRRYDDLRELRKLGDLVWARDGEVVSARVRVADLRVEPTFRRRVQRTVAELEDDTGTITATWFGRRFIERRLGPGDRVVVSGRLKRFGRRLTLDNPEFQRDDESALLHAGRIVPVYRLTAGITGATLRRTMRGALDLAGRRYPEYLPADVAARRRLPAVGEALEEAHFPTSFERRDEALDRLAFDELLALQLGMVGRRRGRVRTTAAAVPVDDPTDGRIRDAIVAGVAAKAGRAITLTTDQDRAIRDVRADLSATSPMLRLLQGDVGSGKTAVAAWALAAAALAGRQGALLAPTDLLARQHHRTLIELLGSLGLPVELLTGSLRAGDAARVRELLASGMAPIVVGTHALFSDASSFADLGLVVIDEQHRFGVDQRSALEAKSRGGAPHVLLMTATPIPRTLGQVLYADLDVTDLRTPPEGRIPIRTGIRAPADLDRTWSFVREQAAAGHRTFVVVPRIGDAAGDGDGSTSETDPGGDAEDDVAAEALAAEAEFRRLTETLAPLRVGLVHGRLKAADRDAEMARFRDGELDVLVGTTVVEVGVDVPEATVMVVEGADLFGLAQLHQLRGRVGRGTADSYCVLVSDSTDDVARARLAAVQELRDGFALAERDWELRREGNVLGLVQSGLPQLRVASLQLERHRELAIAAREAAEALLDDAGRLAPEHGPLARELRGGWLSAITDAEPAGAA